MGVRRIVVSSVVALALLSSTVLASPVPSGADAATVPVSSCPELTDSIRRLYLAYFNREPDATGFLDWVAKYQSGEADLPTISESLADSEEFRIRYGSVSDERFVELVYRNVLRRPPDDEGREHWTSSLAAGYPRGRVMVTLSESEEFVRRTGTATPLAGFLRWYPEGAHWYCGVGSAPVLTIKSLTEPILYADFLFHNGGDDPSRIGLHTAFGSERHVTMTQADLPPGFTTYRWDGRFNGDGNYGTDLHVEAGPSTGWTVVFYPRSIGSQRMGWQITR